MRTHPNIFRNPPFHRAALGSSIHSIFGHKDSQEKDIQTFFRKQQEQWAKCVQTWEGYLRQINGIVSFPLMKVFNLVILCMFSSYICVCVYGYICICTLVLIILGTYSYIHYYKQFYFSFFKILIFLVDDNKMYPNHHTQVWVALCFTQILIEISENSKKGSKYNIVYQAL